jgi:hypothetical protein
MTWKSMQQSLEEDSRDEVATRSYISPQFPDKEITWGINNVLTAHETNSQEFKFQVFTNSVATAKWRLEALMMVLPQLNGDLSARREAAPSTYIVSSFHQTTQRQQSWQNSEVNIVA